MIALTFVHFLSNFVFSVMELLIGIRVFLKLFGGSTTAPFVAWIYETTEPLLAPFAGIFPNPQISGGFILEFSALFALIVYALVGYLANHLISSFISQEVKRVRREGKNN